MTSLSVTTGWFNSIGLMNEYKYLTVKEVQFTSFTSLTAGQPIVAFDTLPEVQATLTVPE
jgi:hypothetical protein